MDNLKICSVCNISKINSDYVNSSDECYKCVYVRKIQELKLKDGKPLKSKNCRICFDKLPNQRWVYCSQACSNEAKRREPHWTLKCKADAKNWKKRFLF